MAPILSESAVHIPDNADSAIKVLKEANTTAILHRTPWTPPVAVAGEGIYITLKDGTKLIDAVGGAAVSAIGMGHPTVVKAVQDQVAKVAYVYNMQLSNEPAEELAKLLVSTSKGAFAAVGFVSGGTEAMEAAIKTAKQYWYELKQPQRINYIARELSFHGNSVATLSLGHHAGRRAPYTDILNNVTFHHVSPAYAFRFKKPEESEEQYVQRLADELEAKFQELGPDTVAAFAAETVVGATTGCVPAPKGYFAAMKKVCDRHGALFILDEVMSGMGRMGTLHAWESFGDGVQPDIQAVAKGLGGGYAPMGALLMSKRVSEGIRDQNGFWKHGHTYQAHPVSCAAALAVQKVVIKENLLEACQPRSKQLETLLRAALQGPNTPEYVSKYVADIRGGGLFWGIEFETGPEEAKKLGGVRFGIALQDNALTKQHMVIIGMGGTVDGVRGDHAILAPPLNVTEQEVQEIVDRFVTAVEQTCKKLEVAHR
ncbi:PLP-dependent transferase [Clavulina sp. PMI_390]|nr:PLP-dependent transferase [Clavulina sp. PMI_390]